MTEETMQIDGKTYKRTNTPKPMIYTQQYLKLLFDYNSSTGIFCYRYGNNNNKLAGSIAGSKEKSGYITLCINSISYKAHRVAWFYTYNEWPEYLDHINGIRDDNRIENLRITTKRLNSINTEKHRNGKLPYTRYIKNCNPNKYVARVRFGTNDLYLGYFYTELEAHLVGKRFWEDEEFRNIILKENHI